MAATPELPPASITSNSDFTINCDDEQLHAPPQQIESFISLLIKSIRLREHSSSPMHRVLLNKAVSHNCSHAPVISSIFAIGYGTPIS